MIAFVSNFYNHHQAPLSRALHKLTDGSYKFICTMSMDDERKKLGWNDCSDSFVIQYSEDESQCQKIIDNADVLIFGSAPYSLIKKRLKNNKLTFIYSERVYKIKCPTWQIPLRSVKYFFKFTRFNNLYLLCASAYTASDYLITGTFKNKAYKWGYFPEMCSYSEECLLSNKHNNVPKILWAGRLLDWKHPECALALAAKLRDDGYEFELDMIGNGEQEETLRKYIVDNNLSGRVKLLGSMSPECVRSQMEESNIFLFTSDRREGWGAVLNEAMNSGCAVVASRAAGAVPYLLEHGVNGYVYDTEEELYEYTRKLLTSAELCIVFGRDAYKTIAGKWNAEIAAENFLSLVSQLNYNAYCDVYDNGPCSKA